MPRGYDVFDQANIERRLLPASTAIRGYNNLVLYIAGSGIRTTESIIDISPTTKPLTLNGGVTISNTQADPYGTNNGVLAFNGTDAQIKCFDFDGSFQLGGSGSDFTIGFWVYFNSLSSASQYLPIATTWENAVTAFAGKWFIGLFNGSLRWFNDAGNVAITDTATPLATWVNYMVVRSGSTITLYKNGVAIGTQTTAQNYFGLLSALDMGFVTSGGAYLNAFVYNFRIFKGAAIQTTNFPLMLRTQVEAQIAAAAFNVNDRRAFSNRVLGFSSAYVNRPFLAGDGVNPQLWSPIQLNPSIWLDAADSSTITLSGSNVTQWNDKSGNSRNFANANTAEQPLYSATSFNGRAGITFDGANDTLTITGLGSLFNNTTHGIYYVMQRVGGGSGDAYRPDIGGISSVVGVDAGALHYIKTDNNGASYPYFNIGGNYDNAPAGYANNTPYIMAFQSNTTGWGVWRNGTLEGTTNALAAPTTQAGGYSLARQFFPSRASNLVMSEVIFVQNANTANRQLIEGYLAWKWGFQTSLPANHPYRNSPPTTNV